MKKILCIFLRCTIFLFFNSLLTLGSLAQKNEALIYDQQGRLIQRNRINFNGQIENDFFGIGIITYEYDERGNLSKKAYYTKDNKVYLPDITYDVANFPSYTLFKYNKKNKLVCMTNYYADGKIMNMNSFDKAAITMYKYNKCGLLIEKSTYDKNKKLVAVGDMQVAITKYIYNDKKQLIEENLYDTNKLYIYLAFHTRYEYDGEGKITKRTYLYGDGKVVLYTLFSYNADKQLILEEDFEENGQKESYKIYTYKENKLAGVESYYETGAPYIQNAGAVIKLHGWTAEQLPEFKSAEGLSGKAIFNIRINKQGKIVAVEEGSGRFDINYDLLPYLKELQFTRDESISDPKLKGTIEITLLNLDSYIQEY